MLSLKISSLERSEAKCTHIIFFRWLYNDHSLTVSATQHWLFKQRWSIFINLGVTREVIENRGEKGELQKFTWWWLLFLEIDHRLTQQYCPQPFFPIDGDSNSADSLFQPVPSQFLNSHKMTQNLKLSMFRLWPLKVKTSRWICPLRGRKVIFGLSKYSFSVSV